MTVVLFAPIGLGLRSWELVTGLPADSVAVEYPATGEGYPSLADMADGCDHRTWVGRPGVSAATCASAPINRVSRMAPACRQTLPATSPVVLSS